MTAQAGMVAAMSTTNAWDMARAAYFAAKGAEDAFDVEHIAPTTAGLTRGADLDAAVAAIPRWIWGEAERLMDIRLSVEELLMDIPAPDGAGLALKYLVAFGDDREADHYREVIEADARRLLEAELP